MRRKTILSNVRRLRCLLSISEGGSRSRSSGYTSSHLLSEVHSDSSSSSSAFRESPVYIPSSDLKRSCSSRVGDGDGGLAIHLTSSLGGASSSFDGDSFSSPRAPVALAILPPSSSSRLVHQFFNTYYSLSSASAYFRQRSSSFQVSAALSSSSSSATTTRERLRLKKDENEDEDEEEQRQQQLGGHDDEKQQQQQRFGGEVSITKGHGKLHTINKEQFVVVEEVSRSHPGQQQKIGIDGNGKVTTDSNVNDEGKESSGGGVGRDDDELRTSSRGWKDLGWTREEVFNWPNFISMARLVSGPFLAWMIVHELWSPALVGLALAGVSDWLDGYVARRMSTDSVLGSYLDPVADKFLIGSVAVAMAYSGLLHPALVGLIVARDGGLMGGAFVYRAYSLGWQWNDWREFFRISTGGASRAEPLFISKVNTVLQLALVGMGLLEPALSLGDQYSFVPLLSWAVLGTTSLSGIAYIRVYMKNPENLAALRRIAQASKNTKHSG